MADSVTMNDPHRYEFAQPRTSLGRFRVYAGLTFLIGGLLAAGVGMSLGADGETLMFVGICAAFLGAARLLRGLIGVSYED